MHVPYILKVNTGHTPGSIAGVLAVIADAALSVDDIRAAARDHKKTTWEITLASDDHDKLEQAVAQIEALPTATVAGRSDRVFERHRGGKLRTVSRIDIHDLATLRDVYTPGVARVCLAIQEDPEKLWEYTSYGKTVAIVTNGTAVLGLGDIGAAAGLPVMEGKAALFEQLVGLSGVPILIESHDPATIVEAVVAIAPSFGAIQLEDIAAPACFEVEAELHKRLDIPVMHDDQHGTAVVALAALLSATRSVGLDLRDQVVGQVGLGAAGIGICRLLQEYGVRKVVGADLNAEAVSRFKSMGGHPIDLPGVLKQANVVVATTGAKGIIKPNMVQKGQVILALSNPEPEIEPDVALAHGAAFAADGKAVNNVLGFPGIFRGVLDARAAKITDEMLLAAAQALSQMGGRDTLVPDPLRPEVHVRVAAAVGSCARSRSDSSS